MPRGFSSRKSPSYKKNRSKSRSKNSKTRSKKYNQNDPQLKLLARGNRNRVLAARQNPDIEWMNRLMGVKMVKGGN